MKEKSRLNHGIKVYCPENTKYINELGKKNIDKFVGPILTLDLTNACNYNCKHCIDYRLVQRDGASEMDFDILCFLIKELYEKGCRNIELTGGGEPTMYSKFEEFCRYAAKIGYHLALVTNGSNLGRILQVFEDVHFDWVRISIDAVDPQLYGEIHGISGNILNYILKNITLVAAQTDVGISYILSKKTVKDVYKALDIADKLKVAYFEVKPLRNKDSGESEISDNEYQMVITRLKSKVLNSDIELLYPLSENRIGSNIREEKFVCWSSYLRTVLTPSGMYRCSYLRGSNDRKPIPHNVEEYIKYRNELNNCKKKCYNMECSRHKLNEEIEKYITGLWNGAENEIKQEIGIKDGRWL